MSTTSLFSHPLDETSESDNECTSATPTGSKPALNVKIGPFDVALLSPVNTPQPSRPSSAVDSQATVGDVWRTLHSPTSSILAALERSGEMVDEAFVRRWVDKRSSDILGELDAHTAWRTVFVADSSGYGIREERIGELLDAGVVYLQGNVASGHPLLIFRAQRYDASRYSSQLCACLVYAMDAAIRCADVATNPKRQVLWLFDLANVSRKNCSIEFLESVFTLFQGHYPECLRRLYFVNAPFLFWGLWAMASVFVDVKTREKIVFCRSTEVQKLDPSADILPEAYGGRARLRSLRRAVAMVRQGKRPGTIPEDCKEWDGEAMSKVPVFHPYKSIVFWLLFTLCLAAWILVKVWECS